MMMIIIPLFTMGNAFNIKASLLENGSKSKHIFESGRGFNLVELGTNVKQIQLVI